MYKNKKSALDWNIKTHDKIAKKYEKIHGEIYNEIEQNRINSILNHAISCVNTVSNKKVALDFGCGAGNLTSHLVSFGYNVIASDISKGFLDLIDSRSYKTDIHTIQLNGVDLSGIADESVDMVATYSVLHHVPDYLSIIKEFMRVLKPGGVVYIDHEPSEEFWVKNQLLSNFEMEMNKVIPVDFSKYFVLANYYDWLIRKFVNPRYHREGDIHVFEDDHVEWHKIVESMVAEGGQVALSQDYLLFRRKYDVSIYNMYKERISDMHVLVMRKL